jgi:hypothetical protein
MLIWSACRRKSIEQDADAAAASLGFGKKRTLDRSRDMLAMFVRRCPKTSVKDNCKAEGRSEGLGKQPVRTLVELLLLDRGIVKPCMFPKDAQRSRC